MGLVPLGTIGLALFAMDLFIIGVPPLKIPEGNSVMTASAFFHQAITWRIFVDLSLIGLFGGLYIVPLYALIQKLSHVSHRARIIAANNILNALFMVMSALLTITLFSFNVSIPQIFLVVAVLHLVITALVFVKVPEFVHRFLILTGLNS
ncbi:MAG: transporter [Gammaproteobacteria bacterium]|nr:transporter [Gammaproteobacteria bacterium]